MYNNKCADRVAPERMCSQHTSALTSIANTLARCNMFGYVYRTYHSATGYYYIGRHISDHFDPLYKGSGAALKRAWKIIHRSEWQVELLAIANTLDELNKLEKEYVSDLFKSDDYCLNRRPGGTNGDKHSITTIKHLKEAFERTRKTREFRFHNNFSDSGLQKLRDIHIGERNPMFGVTGSKHSCSVPVYCHELDRVFSGMAEANRLIGVPEQNISKVCKGLRKTAGGYHWSYADQIKSDKKN